MVILLISMSHWKMLFSIELLKSTRKDTTCQEALALVISVGMPVRGWGAVQKLNHPGRVHERHRRSRGETIS